MQPTPSKATPLTITKFILFHANSLSRLEHFLKSFYSICAHLTVEANVMVASNCLQLHVTQVSEHFLKPLHIVRLPRCGWSSKSPNEDDFRLQQPQSLEGSLHFPFPIPLVTCPASDRFLPQACAYQPETWLSGLGQEPLICHHRLEFSPRANYTK